MANAHIKIDIIIDIKRETRLEFFKLTADQGKDFTDRFDHLITPTEKTRTEYKHLVNRHPFTTTVSGASKELASNANIQKWFDAAIKEYNAVINTQLQGGTKLSLIPPPAQNTTPLCIRFRVVDGVIIVVYNQGLMAQVKDDNGNDVEVNPVPDDYHPGNFVGNPEVEGSFHIVLTYTSPLREVAYVDDDPALVDTDISGG